MISEVIFTEYNIAVPEFFIKFIGDELGKRDLTGLTNGRIQAIYPSGEHPFVQLTGVALSSGGQGVNFAGILPAISVVESDENEENTTLGQGIKYPMIINQTFLDLLASDYGTMEMRVADGLITNKQISDMQGMINNHTEVNGEIEEFWMRESIFVSLWAENLQDRQIIGRLLRSIVFNMRKSMIAKRVVDITIRISKGLVNFNFARVLHGMEMEISFRNIFKNVTVKDEKIIDKTMPVYSVGKFKSIDDTTKVNISTGVIEDI